ncbi:hypothetical protein U9R71_28340 [Bacillus toyonensis]|uniref:Uncharacterized protein n=1 Tax=Bacillus wiedmannii TaxID=1890302 RepID=A0A0G8BVE7_9BACI|nr:hypothetical protein B4147_0249 [Bacillus wiedmannii]MED3398395.1 hypothetical protein [Bacillus wiedmannii]
MKVSSSYTSSLLIFLPLHHNEIGIIVGKTIDFYDLAKVYV